MGFVIRLRPDGGVPEWLKGADCKSVGVAYAGSNPASPTNKFTSTSHQHLPLVDGTQWRQFELNSTHQTANFGLFLGRSMTTFLKSHETPLPGPGYRALGSPPTGCASPYLSWPTTWETSCAVSRSRVMCLTGRSPVCNSSSSRSGTR